MSLKKFITTSKDNKMGLFSKLIGGTKDNQHIAKGVSSVQSFLRDYEWSKDEYNLVMAAYITRLAILDTFEKSGYNAMNVCYVTIDGHLTKLTWLQANLMTYGRISNLLENTTADTKDLVEAILNKEDAFYEIDKAIPYEMKKEFIS